VAVDQSPREPSDVELLAAVAAGDENAFGVLWARHADAARRLAALLTRRSNINDLLSEAFVRVLRAVRGGDGPESAFRPYLFEVMRGIDIDRARLYRQRVSLIGTDQPLDQPLDAPLDQLLDHEQTTTAGDVSYDDEQRAAWRAWESLPDDIRALLWHLVVEDESPAEVALLLGVSANEASAHAAPAKERLRQAMLAQHLAQADDEACRATGLKLGSYVRDALSARDRAVVQEHLDGCPECTAAVAELRDVDSTLRGVIAPILLGGTAIAVRYLGTQRGAAATGTSALAGTAVATAGSTRGARHALRGWPVAKVVGTAIGGVAAIVTVGALLTYLAANGGSPSRATAHAPLAGGGSSDTTTRAAGSSPAVTSSRSPSKPAGSTRASTAAASTSTAHDVADSSRTSATTTHSSGSASSTSPSPPPSTVRQVIGIPLPGAADLGTVTVTMPNGWTIVSATGYLVRLSGDGVHDATWTVAGDNLAVTVTGRSDTSGTMHVHITTVTGSTDRSYQLG
jgi:RNA polymerase sigma factor (sigma-70 family)